MFLFKFRLNFILNYSLDSECLTPDRLYGTCLNILECPPLLKSLRNTQRSQQETRYLQSSQCGKVGNSVYVCCHYEKENRFFIPTAQQQHNAGLSLLPSTRQCGRSFDNRIYGGTTTKIDEYPWVALIEYTKRKYEF